MFHIVKPDLNFDFVGKRNLWLGMSVVMILATFALFFTKGLNYGIDFTGGAEIKAKLPQDWNTEKVRSLLEAEKLTGLKILQLGETSESTFLIRAQDEGKDLNQVVSQIQGALSKGSPEGSVEIKSADIVGPSAGGLLRKNGFLAMFYALIGILLYVAIRFDLRYAPGAVLALFHDTALVLGIFVISQMEFDLTVLAAILALIGYSNNDTIIVFDRVREVQKQNPNANIEKVVNDSINQTLGRTIMTSLTTFLSVMMLYFFGGVVLKPFAFALLTGIIVGAYSSVFIASSMVIFLTQYQSKREKSGKTKKRREVKLSPEAHIGV